MAQAQSVFMWAVEQGHEAQEAFDWACFDGDVVAVRAALATRGVRCVDLNDPDTVPLASAVCHVEVVRELLAVPGRRAVNVHLQDEFAFLHACQEDAADTVELLLSLTGERTVDVHADNDRAMFYAMDGPNLRALDIVRMLLALEGPQAMSAATVQGAFECAAEVHNKEVLQELLGLTGPRAVDVHTGRDYALRMACETAAGDPRCCPLHLPAVHVLVGLRGARAPAVPVLLQECRKACKSPALLAALLSGDWAPLPAQVAAWVAPLQPPVRTQVLRVYADARWRVRRPAVLARAVAVRRRRAARAPARAAT